jgi:hypothetical protein
MEPSGDQYLAMIEFYQLGVRYDLRDGWVVDAFGYVEDGRPLKRSNESLKVALEEMRKALEP